MKPTNVLRSVTIASLALCGSLSAAQDAVQDAGQPEESPHIGARFGLPPVGSDADYDSLPEPQKQLYNRLARPELRFFVDGQATWIGNAGFDSLSGKLTISRVSANAGIAMKLSETADLSIGFGSEYSFYDFDNATGFVSGTSEPFDDVGIYSITPVYSDFNEKGWAWFLGGTIESAGEAGADFSDTITGGGFGGASYRVNSNLRLGLGLSVSHNLAEDDVYVLPFPIISWQINDRFTLESMTRGARLAYTVNTDWTLALEAGYERRNFRLDDNGPLPGGAVIDSSVPVALSATYKPDPQVEIVGRVGTLVYGDLEFYDANANEVSDDKRESSLFAGVHLQLKF